MPSSSVPTRLRLQYVLAAVSHGLEHASAMTSTGTVAHICSNLIWRSSCYGKPLQRLYRCLLKLKYKHKIPRSNTLLKPLFCAYSHSWLTILNASASYGGPAVNFMIVNIGPC